MSSYLPVLHAYAGEKYWDESKHPRDEGGRFTSGGEAFTRATKKPKDWKRPPPGKPVRNKFFVPHDDPRYDLPESDPRNPWTAAGVDFSKSFYGQNSPLEEWIEPEPPVDPRVPAFSQEQVVALQTYADEGFREINSALRSGKLDARTAGLVKTIDGAMDKSFTNLNLVVYRLQDKEFASGLKVGQVIKDKGFVSTCVDRSYIEGVQGDTAKMKGSVVMKIRVPEGTKAIYLSAGISNMEESERELLLNRGTRFKVTGVSAKTIMLDVVK